MSVIVTAVGSGVGYSVAKALARAGRTVIGTDLEVCGGLLQCDAGYLVPRPSDGDYPYRLAEIAREEGAVAIIPGCDPELPYLAAMKAEIEDQCDATVIVNSEQAVEIGRDKMLTVQWLEQAGFDAPHSIPRQSLCKHCDYHRVIEGLPYPMIAKPRDGSGSKGLYRIGDVGEMIRYFACTEPGYVFQEELQGPEYTVGAVGSGGEVWDLIAMRRELKRGASWKAQVDDRPEILEYVEAVASKLEIEGGANFQLRLTEERGPVIFEINPRFSGTTAARAFAGMNGPQISVCVLAEGRNPPQRRSKRSIAMFRSLRETYGSIQQIEDIEQRGGFGP